MNIFDYLIPISLAAVFIVLLLGLWNMMRGGNSNKSQMFMRWRVGLQFVAIIILVAGLYFTRR
jgi:Hypoxia induced protein conserved region